MRIVNAVFNTRLGGVEQSTLDYAEALASQGHEVTLLLHAKSEYIVQAAQTGCAVDIQPNRFGRYDVLTIRRIRKWLLQVKPDVVLAHDDTAIALLSAAAYGIAPCVAVHPHQLSRALLRMAAVITTTNEQASRIRHRGMDAESVFTLPNMVRLSKAQRALRVSHAPQTPPVLGTLARLVKPKGVDVLLDAVALLHKRGVQVRLRIGGNGPLRKTLQVQAAERGIAGQVEFLGWVRERENFYASLDMYCLPSRAETFGLTALEAFQHKLPVVATNCSGVRQLSERGNVTLMVPVEDAVAMADAIERLLKDWTQAQRLAAAGYALVKERYEMATVGRQVEAVLIQALASAQQEV